MKETVLKGAIGGAIVGLLAAFSINFFVLNWFVRREDFGFDVAWELRLSELRYQVAFLCVLIFAGVGSIISGISTGRWLRDSIYGTTGMLTLVVATALTLASLRNEFPMNHFKGASQTSIDMARNYGFPLSLILGPIIGVSIGGWWRRPLSRSGDEG